QCRLIFVLFQRMVKKTFLHHKINQSSSHRRLVHPFPMLIQLIFLPAMDSFAKTSQTINNTYTHTLHHIYNLFLIMYESLLIVLDLQLAYSLTIINFSLGDNLLLFFVLMIQFLELLMVVSLQISLTLFHQLLANVLPLGFVTNLNVLPYHNLIIHFLLPNSLFLV